MLLLVLSTYKFGYLPHLYLHFSWIHLYRNDDYVETSVSSCMLSVLTAALYSGPDFRPATTTLLPFYDQHTYLCASSAYSALVQLYARSDQLDTRTHDSDVSETYPTCVLVDAMHLKRSIVFSFHALHIIPSTSTPLKHSPQTSRILNSLLICRAFLRIVPCLFEDGPVWLPASTLV